MKPSPFDSVGSKPSANGRADASDGADGQKHSRSKGKKKADKQPSQAEQLLTLADGQVYFHGTDGTAYAVVNVDLDGRTHQETLGIKRQDFRSWLGRRYFMQTRKAPSAGILQDVLNVLDARARYDGPQLDVWCRAGHAAGKVYLDLADRTWRVVEIDGDGWRVLDRSPVRFRRPKGMLALPEPRPDGTIEELRPFVNLDGDKDNWLLVVGWLVQALSPTGPYPVLCLYGEQGSAKSTLARVLRQLVDPSKAPLRSLPRDERDLIIAAGNSWLVTLDNLSKLDGWLSDALCRLATGGGFSTRELYTDADEVIFDAQRPVLINGIEELAARPDLLDRAIVLQLLALDEKERLTERTFWERFEQARPRILGALLSALSGALRLRDQVQTDRLPRMADFALLAEAAGRGLGWAEGAFLDAYELNRDEQNAATLDASVIFDPLKTLLEGKSCWEGTCKELLTDLASTAPDKTTKGRNWPKSSRALSGMLRRLTTNLRREGFLVTFVGRAPNRGRARVVRIETEQICKRPSTPSTPSDEQEFPESGVDGYGRSAEEQPSTPPLRPGVAADGADGVDGEMHSRSVDGDDADALRQFDEALGDAFEGGACPSSA